MRKLIDLFCHVDGLNRSEVIYIFAMTDMFTSGVPDIFIKIASGPGGLEGIIFPVCINNQ